MDILNQLLNYRKQLLDCRENSECSLSSDAYNALIKKCEHFYSMLSENQKLLYRDEIVTEYGGTRNGGERIIGTWKRMLVEGNKPIKRAK